MEGNMQEEEEEEQSRKQEPRRLSDFLLESDEELPVETNSGNKILTKSSAVLNSNLDSASGLGRLIRSALFGKKSKTKKKGGDKEILKEKKIPEPSQKNSVSSVPKPGNDNTSLSLGMGVGLFLLLAKTSYEYSKMSELHKQMKQLLEEIKSEFENKIFSPTSSDLCCNSSKIREDAWFENKRAINCDQMDQMEAELKFEFDRMRSNFSEEGSSVEQKNEMHDEWIDFCENLGANLEQNDETGEDETIQDFGVCPFELERKLHQLLNQRQEERIKELESQLQNLERKLLEMELLA